MYILIASFTSSLITAVGAEETTTTAFLAFRPNPIGVGQELLVTMGVQPFPISRDELWQGFTVTITTPSGEVVTKGPYGSDYSGLMYFTYVPEEVGNYTLQFSFPGQTTSLATFKASSSPKMSLSVQSDLVLPWQETPPPTDYWTRPVNSINRQWASIMGDWLMSGYNATANYNPYTLAPNTAHIVWTREERQGGIVGGDLGDNSYHNNWRMVSPPVIINGKLYYNKWSSWYGGPSTVPPGYVCVDLRTGKTLWMKDNVTISLGQEVFVKTYNVMGVFAYLWTTGSTYYMHDALTGDTILTFKNAQTGTNTFDENGNLIVYTLNTQGNATAGWLSCWNSTKAILNATNPSNWAPNSGMVIDWSLGLEWNRTIPREAIRLSIKNIASDVILAKARGATYNAFVGYSQKTGDRLWPLLNVTVPQADAATAGNGIFVQFDAVSMRWLGYDLNTGKQFWTSDSHVYPWGGYTDNSPQIINGYLYATGYDGYMHAFDIKTGKLVWKYFSGNSGYETPYGEWPIFGAPLMADGKIFGVTGEHSPTEPYYRGEALHVMNATTGEGIWNITGWWLGGAVADGYYLAINSYDGRLYGFGKGQTATTVTASPSISTHGDKVLIQGSVTDQSPGAKDTPAIADKDMTKWMEYLYEQQQKPANASGVEVILETLDPNDNSYEIGRTISDDAGNYRLLWQPKVPGEYKLIATFRGSESYFSSTTETFVAVEAAPESSSTQQQIVVPDYTMTIIGVGIAVVIAVAMVGLLLFVALKKRQ